MANEFIARKGLIVLANGIVATGSTNINGDITASGDVRAVNFRGSGQYLTDIAADSVQFSNVLNKPTLISASAQFKTLTDPFTGSFTGSFFGDGSQLTGVASSLKISGSTSGADTVNLSTETLTFSGSNNVTAAVTNNTVTIGVSGLVSQSSQIDVRNTTGIQTIATTGSNTFTGTQTIGGNIFLNTTNPLVYNNSANNSLLFGFFDGSSIYGPYFQIFGNNYTNAAQRGGAEFVYDTRNGGDGNFHVASYDGSTFVQRFRVDNVGTQVTGSLEATAGITGSFKGDGSQLTGIATVLGISGSTSGVDTVNLKTDSLVFSGSSNVTATVTNNTVTIGVTGLVSQSSQIDVRNTTGIATIATTGSNTFTDVQTISNTTNSTAFNNGALIVQGGVGITKDVNISGSLNVQGVLTVATMSTQYVTSSQLNIGTSKIVLNDDDLVRFAGISVIDSGSTFGTGSLLWDSLTNRWIYQADDQNYNSAVIIAGPKNFGGLGNEVGLTAGRVPVATGDDHIDTAAASSSIRIDYPSLRTHIEAGLYVTGAITSSVGFSGDGSNLTGVVSTLSVTGSQAGTGAINLKTQGLIVSGTNGIVASVSGQTLTISGSNATTTTKGVASFNNTNFTVTGGEVTSNNITINGTAVTLGGTRNITLAEVTAQGATTTNAVTLSGGATIGNSFQTSSTYVASGPTTNEVVVSLATGSYDAAHFDYVIKDGTNFRTGTVMSIWNGATVEHTDTSTNDIGNTRAADFTVDTSSGNVRLKFSVTSGTWTIKTAARLI